MCGSRVCHRIPHYRFRIDYKKGRDNRMIEQCTCVGGEVNDNFTALEPTVALI